MFSPNGTLPNEFWPDQEGADFSFKSILKPLEAFKDRMLVLHGIANKVRGDGDSHMRGMSCLLTCDELLKGNIMGGGGNPAGWASNISIDQELKNFLQSRAETKTRFGSLEFGVAVPDRADPWTRMSYAGGNQPVAPIDDPHQILKKVYGQMKDKDSLVSILDDVRDDLKRISSKLSARDRALLDQHVTLVRSMEQDLADADKQGKLAHPVPQIDPSIELVNDNTPQISRIQIDLLVNCLANDMARIGTLQYMRSVGCLVRGAVGVAPPPIGAPVGDVGPDRSATAGAVCARFAFSAVTSSSVLDSRASCISSSSLPYSLRNICRMNWRSSLGSNR